MQAKNNRPKDTLPLLSKEGAAGRGENAWGLVRPVSVPAYGRKHQRGSSGKVKFSSEVFGLT